MSPADGGSEPPALGDRSTAALREQLGAPAMDGVGVVQYLEPVGAQPFFSSWPPNCFRIADRTRSAKSSRSLEANRSYSAVVSTPAGTPSSIAAIEVQRPSPESETRPSKPERSGDSWNEAAVRSRSHDPTTLPRRQTSAIWGMSMSYW